MWNKPQLLNALSDLLILAAAAALLAAATVWLIRVPSLPVRQVVFVEALPQTKRAEIEAVLPAALQGNFFSMNLETVRAAMETLPWVRHVEVRRVWPEKLELKVEEHKPVARWGDGRGELVNSYGEVFAAMLPADSGPAMPVLFGPSGTAAEVLRRYGEFSDVFLPTGQQPVAVTLSPRLAWQLKLKNGMSVDIGREQPKSPIATRLQRFVEIYPEAVAKRAVLPVGVDLRYPNGFAVKAAGDGKGK